MRSGLPDIPISPVHRLALLNGTKLSITSLEKYGEEGTLFQAFGETFEIVKVVQCPLIWVASQFFKVEGFGSPDEFIEDWRQTYPDYIFEPEQTVYMHIVHKMESVRK